MLVAYGLPLCDDMSTSVDASEEYAANGRASAAVLHQRIVAKQKRPPFPSEASYHPSVSGPPLNGPTTSGVIQPP